MVSMLKKFAFGLISLLLVFGLLGAALAEERQFLIDDVDFDDPVAPGDVVPITITLANTATSDDVEDIVVKVWIEDDQGDRLGDKIKYNVKRIHQDDEKDITINLPIPIDAVEDVYTLYITAEGEWEGKDDVSAEWVDELEVEQQEHSLYIESVELSTDHVVVGETLDVAIKIANNGREDESNIKIKVEIPEIGAEKTVSILNTLGSGYDYTAYLTLEIPEADAGIYTFVAKVYNVETGDTYEQDIVVEEAELVVVEEPATGASVSLPAMGTITQTIEAGKGSIFSIEVKNNEDVAKTFDFVVGGVTDWATARVDPSQLTIGPGETEMVYVYVLPTDTGEHAFTLYVKENGITVAANQIKVNVVGGVAETETVSNLGNFFAFLVLVFVLVVAGYLYKKEQFGGKGAKQIYY